MKVLTLHQPWATLIVAGHKRYETRSWRTSYRGPVLIHAGKQIDRYFADWLIAKGDPAGFELGTLPTGALIGIATILDTFSTNRFVAQGLEHGYGDWTSNRWAWQMDGAFRFKEPIECRGQRGLWELPPEIELLVNSSCAY